jgi:nucleotidyltransferase AbiEii toxin of type IV toxin-antitoxin system
MTDIAARALPGEEPSLPDKVIAIHEALQAAKIPHAVGGALALAYYATPRATIDIDLNVFVPSESWQDVIETLEPLGVATAELDSVALERDGQCRLWWGDNPIDLFFSYDPIHAEMRKEARRVPFGEITLPILAPEHLAVCKAMFDRRKDWLDIEQMLLADDGLDASAVEEWLERMVGKRDPRMKRLAELQARI